DDRRPYQKLRHMTGPARRHPDVDIAARPIAREAVADEQNAHERHQREQALVGALADARDQGCALRPQRDKGMAAEKDGEPDDHDCKAHAASPSTSPRTQTERSPDKLTLRDAIITRSAVFS